MLSSRRVVVIDAGASRAALIPCTHNHAGYPEGIRGTDESGTLFVMDEMLTPDSSRYWPAAEGPFHEAVFEDEYRTALRSAYPSR